MDPTIAVVFIDVDWLFTGLTVEDNWFIDVDWLFSGLTVEDNWFVDVDWLFSGLEDKWDEDSVLLVGIEMKD